MRAAPLMDGAAVEVVGSHGDDAIDTGVSEQSDAIESFPDLPDEEELATALGFASESGGVASGVAAASASDPLVAFPGLPNTEEAIAECHALIESRLEFEYASYRSAMTPTTAPDLPERAIRLQWMAEHYNRTKADVEHGIITGTRRRSFRIPRGQGGTRLLPVPAGRIDRSRSPRGALAREQPSSQPRSEDPVDTQPEEPALTQGVASCHSSPMSAWAFVIRTSLHGHVRPLH